MINRIIEKEKAEDYYELQQKVKKYLIQSYYINKIYSNI